jgi:large subunit ribosomal protein L18
MKKTHTLRLKRHTKIRSKVIGTSERPRLAVYRGLRHLYAQLIDDTAGKTLIGLSDKSLLGTGAGMQRAAALGEEIAKLAKEKGIKTVVFDRGGFRYHGQVKVLADTLRQSGIIV